MIEMLLSQFKKEQQYQSIPIDGSKVILLENFDTYRTTANSWSDLSGNATFTKMTASSRVGEDEGLFGNSAYISGGNYIRADFSNQPLNLADFTLSVWVKPLSNNNNVFVRFTEAAGQASKLCLQTNVGAFYTYLNGVYTQTNGVAYADYFGWNHFCHTRKDGVNRGFVNGQLKHTYTNANLVLTQNTIYLELGLPATDTAGGYVGFMDEILLTRECLYTESFIPPEGPFVLI